ncbi:MAG TPA: hypothetical protein VFK13_03940 [Gemmatimonadaceae bacterium]|nr:hypothetical protein [Gemmatimonadaceae bacterium]
MSVDRRIEAVSWVVTSVLAVVAIIGWRNAAPTPPPTAAAVWRAMPEPAPVSADTLAARAGRVVAGDPFRLERHPAAVPFSVTVDPGAAPTAPPKPPKPPLALAGLVGGPPWEAVLEGVPGYEQSVVVRAGSVLGELRVTRVSRNGVVIVGMDTTWTLTLRTTWK